jgi:hypothetical protein
MKKKHLCVGIFSLLTFALILTGCTNPLTDTNENAEMYGKWQNVAVPSLEWDFFEDNSWAITKGGPFVSGSFFEFDGTLLRAKQNGGIYFEGGFVISSGVAIVSGMKEYDGTWNKVP